MRRLGKILGIIVLVLIAAGASLWFGRHEVLRMYEGLPGFTHGGGDVEEYMVPMEDGVKLYTVVHYPNADGPFPVVLVRSPYAEASAIFRDTICGRFVRYGYICVFQDTRGQGGSEGEFAPLFNEVKDGRDTLEWIVEQDFHDGNIGMMGASYLAAVQWSAAAAGLPEEVKTFVPAVIANDMRNSIYEDGMFRHEAFTAWAVAMRENSGESAPLAEEYRNVLAHMPHNTADVNVLGEPLPWYQDMIRSDAPNAPYWDREEFVLTRSAPQNLEVPILMITGWYDVYVGPQFEDWKNLATQSESRFVVGPWTHIGDFGDALKFPDAGGGFMQWEITLDWLGHHLRGEPLEQNPGLGIYDVRKGEWKDYETWPPLTENYSLYLGDVEASATCEGGTLATSPTEDGGRVSYEYDPSDPVRTNGGAGMLAFAMPGMKGAPPATQWQDEICTRDDILSFLGPELDAPLTISGDIDVNLNVVSTAEDTAFTAKLMEVLPDGRAVNIRDSITSLKYRNGAETPQMYTPGEEVEITIDFWPIEWTVQPGSRLRLDISSSDFPKFHAHPNSAEPWATVEEATVATQTIVSGVSRIDLPIAPSEDE